MKAPACPQLPIAYTSATTIVLATLATYVLYDLDRGQGRTATGEPPPDLGLPRRAAVCHRPMGVGRKPSTPFNIIPALGPSVIRRRIERRAGSGILSSAEEVEGGREDGRQEHVDRGGQDQQQADRYDEGPRVLPRRERDHPRFYWSSGIGRTLETIHLGVLDIGGAWATTCLDGSS